MRFLLWALVLAVLAVLAALVLQQNQGQLVVLAPPYRIDLSLNLALVLLAMAAAAVYWLGRLVQQFASFPRRVRDYRDRRADVGAQRGLREALKALLEGRFARAERAARNAQALPGIAGLASLIGARAAHRMQEYERRDQWLQQAEADPDLAIARRVSAAEMWAEQHQNERALQAIEQLHAAGARHIHALRVALAAHLQASHWEQALRILRALDKHRGLHPAASARFRLIANGSLLREAAGDPVALERQWQRVAPADRLIPDLALDAAQLFNRAGQGTLAARALEASLEEHWSERLLDEYARCEGGAPRASLERAEAWLRRHPRSAPLLRCLGRICLREQLWGKARSYLEEGQRLGADPDGSLALAELAEALGEVEGAAHHHREAAQGFAQRARAATAARAGVRSVRREASL